MTQMQTEIAEEPDSCEVGTLAMNRGAARYRFGFVLTASAGNMNRYSNLRKYANRNPEVECVWVPLNYLDPDPSRMLPGSLRVRAVVMREAAGVTKRMRTIDAVMYPGKDNAFFACRASLGLYERLVKTSPTAILCETAPVLFSLVLAT